MSDGRKFGCWGKGPGVPPPPRVPILVEPANTILVKKINWEVQSRGNAPKAVERWLQSVPSRQVPYATLGHQIPGEPGSEPRDGTCGWPPKSASPSASLTRAVSEPLDLASIVQRARLEHTNQRRREALHVFRCGGVATRGA
mmetsp:Transcript_77361/g.121871  ORF Transcript_77361/g.121871 Transcript_77361/m.121871 type:complete len:142 (+) Transcript_77361:69-494(+)